jgi:hypothetical protein
MTLLVSAVALVVASQLWSSPIANAEGNTNGTAARAVPADHRVDGFTGGQLAGQLWGLGYTATVGTDPAPCITLGRTGKVLHPNSESACTIVQGTPLFLFGWGGSCDDVSPPPDFAIGRAAQLACVRAFFRPDPVVSINVVVDNGPVVDIHAPRFEVASPLEHVQLPPDNNLNVAPQPLTFTVFAWAAMVERLRVGMHSLRIDVTFDDGSVFERTRSVTVVAPHGP